MDEWWEQKEAAAETNGYGEQVKMGVAGLRSEKIQRTAWNTEEQENKDEDKPSNRKPNTQKMDHHKFILLLLDVLHESDKIDSVQATLSNRHGW